MALTEENLHYFCGSSEIYRYNPLFSSVLLSEGAKYIGDNGAYWLMDAIASYQPQLCKKRELFDFQLWILKVENSKGVLICQGDSDQKPVVTQEIEYTDFPLKEIKLYCLPVDEKNRLILLPSEY